MQGRFLLNSKENLLGANIYADKSSIVLDWLLKVGIERESFSLREIAKDRDVSLGLIQRVLGVLIQEGFLETQGIRTGKKFRLKKPAFLIKSWMKHYSIIKKCKLRTYQTGFPSKEKMLKALTKSGLHKHVILALHCAAEAHKCKNTNLNTLELYVMESKLREKIEKTLELEPQEKGYEVLLIEPYYKYLLKHATDFHEEIRVSPTLLTFLDLYHFPLRGQEQAEFMAERILELKRIFRRR